MTTILVDKLFIPQYRKQNKERLEKNIQECSLSVTVKISGFLCLYDTYL